MRSLRNQIRQVLRRFCRTPLFTAAKVITLAVAIGANTAIFSVVESVLLKPLPYPQPEQLVSVRHTAPGMGMKELPTSPSMYFVYREQNRTFTDIGLFDGRSVNVTGVAEPEQVRALRVTDGTLAVLGIPPMLGRWFNRADDTPGAPDTVLLTYGYWRRKFGADHSLVGRSIRVDGKPRTVIGVMPERFHYLDNDDPALILPFQLDRSKTVLGDYSYDAVARLKPTATLADATADVTRMMPVVNRSFPPPPGASLKLFEELHIGPNVRPLKKAVVGDIGELLWVVMGSVAIVLLIACANVANLLLVRAEGRQQELAVRAALGATRARIAAELLSESLLLGLLGSAAGPALAYGALQVLSAMEPAGLPRLGEIGMDGWVLLFTLAVALAASLLFGAIPVFKYADARLGSGLREGGRTLSQSRERHHARNALVVVQVALALVLLISSGLMIRTFRALTGVQPGFSNPAEVQTLRLAIPEAEVADPERVVRMQEQIMRALAAIPGVASVGIGSNVPLDGSISRNPIFAQDRIYREGQLPALRSFKFVSPGYFRTLGTPLVAGRDLTWTDVLDKRPVAMVSENLAREYWRNAAGALGKRIRMGAADDWCEIVGVAADVHSEGVDKDAPASVSGPIMMRHFWSEEPLVRRTLTFAIRSRRAGTESFAKEIRQAVWSVNRNLPLADVHTLDYFYRKSMARTSFTLVMLAVAGAMALLLGIVGLYGVLAYTVSQRTREIGIRMALGAQRQELAGMFVRQGLRLAVAGVACGLAAAFWLMRLVSPLLFRVSPVDAVTYVAVSLGLVATTMLASYLPSRRAARIDPLEALRAE
jgi:predicted permease